MKRKSFILLIVVAIAFLLTGCNSSDYKMHQAYKDVYAKLTSGVWFFEAKSSNAVNAVTFTEEKATLKQIYYDDNGPHSTEMDFDYIVDDKEITILTNKSNNITNEKEIKIQYDFSEDTFSLKGDYLTSEQVEKGLEGYWGLREKSHFSLTGDLTFEYIYYFKNGNVKYESANEAYGRDDGTYYYYGPYKGTYAVTEKGLEVYVEDAEYGSLEFGFVISKGKVYMCRYGKIMSDKYSGFKGEDGFSF